MPRRITFKFLGFGAPYIRNFTVYGKLVVTAVLFFFAVIIVSCASSRVCGIFVLLFVASKNPRVSFMLAKTLRSCMYMIRKYRKPDEACVLNWTGSWSIQVMAHNLVGAMPLHGSVTFSHSTHWDRDNIGAIFQITFSNVFSWMKIYEFRLIFYWSLFLRVPSTILHRWFR